MQSELIQSQKNYRLILVLSACLSIFLSWLGIRSNYVFSSDSLLYIHTAQVFIDEGFGAAVEVYRWPQLSVLIAYTHKVTGLSLINSGLLLITFFYAALTAAFISITKEMGGTTRAQFLALVIISFLPTLNDYRDYITRDTGFWLFTFLSIQQLLRYTAKNRIRNATGWFFFTIAAIAFRTEALFFAAFAPLAVLFDSSLSQQSKLKKVSVLYAQFFCLGVITLAIIVLTPALSEKFRLFHEITNVGSFFNQLFTRFDDSMRVISEAIPYIHFVEDINTIFVFGLAGLVIYTILHALTLPYLILAFWSVRTKPSPSIKGKPYLITYFLIIVGYLMIKTFHGFFTTDRYCLTAAFIIMLILPICVATIWGNNNATHHRLNWKKTLIILLLLYPALDSLINSSSDKAYIANATDWVKQNQSEDTQLLTNHKQIAVLGGSCLSNCFFDDTYNSLTHENIEKHNLLAIRAKEDDTDQLKAIDSLTESANWALTKTFHNKKGDRVFILSSPLPAKEPRQ